LCELISKATAEPGIFTFGELLSLPNVQEVGKEVFIRRPRQCRCCKPGTRGMCCISRSLLGLGCASHKLHLGRTFTLP
jgi:hypothetical protein